ncbi:MAG: AmmeMemoRadiSam system protein A [Thermoleophilia bacterium]
MRGEDQETDGGERQQGGFAGMSQQPGPADYARACVENIVLGRPAPQAPTGSPFTARGACFVTIKSHGNLRGCIGTLTPIQPDLGREIAHNANAAANDDPRFAPVSAAELAALTYSVDVLSAPQPCRRTDLDPRRYGVIVTAGWHRGVLLPGLEGVDDVARQLAIVLQKAGIDSEESATLERFTVRRYREGDTRGRDVGKADKGSGTGGGAEG